MKMTIELDGLTMTNHIKQNCAPCEYLRLQFNGDFGGI